MTPYELVRRSASVQDASKSEMLGITRRLERVALQAPPPAVAAALQGARYVTERTREVYTALAAAGSPARLHARGLQAWLAPGVTGIALDDDDPLVDEWSSCCPDPTRSCSPRPTWASPGARTRTAASRTASAATPRSCGSAGACSDCDLGR